MPKICGDFGLEAKSEWIMNLLQIVARDLFLCFCEIVVLWRGNFKLFAWNLVENWYFGRLVEAESGFSFNFRRVMSGWQPLVGLFFDFHDVLAFFEIEFWGCEPNAFFKAWNNWFWNLISLDSVLVCPSLHYFYVLSRRHQVIFVPCRSHFCGASGRNYI